MQIDGLVHPDGLKYIKHATISDKNANIQKTSIEL